MRRETNWYAQQFLEKIHQSSLGNIPTDMTFVTFDLRNDHSENILVQEQEI
jgi:hypothetical protein